MTKARFRRPSDHRAEWDRLGTPSDDGFYDRLADSTLEVVVTARRMFDTAADRIDEVLIPRVEARIRAVATRMASGYSQLDAEEIEGEIIHAFWSDVLGGESFYEVFFNKALHDHALSARRKVISAKQRTREREAVRIGEVDGGEAEERFAATSDDLVHANDRVVLAAVLDRLPSEIALAMTLHHLMDLKVHSQNREERTVASTMQCSERKARELVAEGMELMRAYSALLEEDARHG